MATSLFMRFLRGIGRFVRNVMLFFGLCLAWTGALYVLQFWSDAGGDAWPSAYPIAVTHVATGTTRVIPYRALAEARNADPSLVPWPVTPSGSAEEDRVHTTWSTVQGERWQFEVRWEERDRLMETRYRLDGDTPVLVATRGRGPALAFQAIILAVATIVLVVLWRMGQWWRRRRRNPQP